MSLLAFKILSTGILGVFIGLFGEDASYNKKAKTLFSLIGAAGLLGFISGLVLFIWSL